MYAIPNKNSVYWLRNLLPLLALIALCAVPLSAFSASLNSVSVRFDTTNNDKDHDTYVDVTIKTADDTVVADATGIGGHWNNNSSNTVALKRYGTVQKDKMGGSTINIHISPNGNDKWEFNCTVILVWDDGSRTEKAYNGNTLTQDNPDMQVGVL